MIFQKGINWNDYDAGKKRGRVVTKNTYQAIIDDKEVTRSAWAIDNPPEFTKDRDFLRNLIPLIPNWEESEA